MSVVDVKKKYERKLLALKGVVGVFADVNRQVLVVLVEDPDVCLGLPTHIEGYPVECRVTGKLRA